MTKPVFLLLILLLAACDSAPPPDPAPLPTLMELPGQASGINLPDVPIRLLNFWVAERGTLNNIDETQVWQFFGESGDLIRVRAVSQEISLRLILLDSQGVVLGEGEQLEEVALPASGVYSVLVNLSEPGSGSYEIGLSYANQANPTIPTPTLAPQIVGVPTPTPPYNALGQFIADLSQNEEVSGSLSESSAEHVYTFNGIRGEYVQIGMERRSGTVDPLLTLYDPVGNRLAMDDNSGGGRSALLRNIRLPQDGRYSIHVSGDGFFGQYALRLLRTARPMAITPEAVILPTIAPLPTYVPPQLQPGINGSRLEDHLPVTSSIEAGGFVRYSIFAAAGETITVGAAPAGGGTLRPQLEVYDPDGALVASAFSSQSNDAGNAFAPAFQAAQNGAYIVFLTGESGSAGEYTLSYGSGVTRQDVFFGEAAPNVRIDHELVWKGLRGVYTLPLRRGDVITAAASASSVPFDPFIEIALPDGTLIASDDNSGGGLAALISGVEITQDGTYLLRVRDARGANAGKYALVWRYINLAPTPTPTPNSVKILSVDDFVPENTYQFYVFQGQAGDRIQIDVAAKAGTLFDPVAALLDPSGREIAMGDDSENGLNPRFTVELPADGTYTVRVNGYLSGGGFDLTVSVIY